MSTTWPITEEGTLLIRQDGKADIRGMHKSLYNWATENNYFFTEKGFTEKVKSHGKEFEIAWLMERQVTPFIKFNINIAIWAHSMNPNKEGDLEGHTEVIFDTYMEMDWQNRWASTKIKKFLLFIYINYIKKQYFLDYAGKCWEETYSLHALVKTFLNEMHSP